MKTPDMLAFLNVAATEVAGWLRECCRVGVYLCVDNTAHKYSNSIDTSQTTHSSNSNLVLLCCDRATDTIGMPVGLSADLRWRIVYLICLRGNTIAQTAKDLYVSHSTVERIVDVYKTTGDVVSVQDRHGPPRKLSEFEELTVLESFFKHPGIYLREVREELFRLTGARVDCSTICRTAQRLDLTRQKMIKIIIKQSDVRRAEYMVEIELFDPEMLVFIDETGCGKHSVVRQYGYGVGPHTSDS
jgi:transposase